MSERTDHGFRIGAIEATALAEWSRGSAIKVEAGRTRFDVQATPKGQNVLIVMPEGDDGRLSVVLPNGDTVAISWYGRWGGSVSRFVDGHYVDGFGIPKDGAA